MLPSHAYPPSYTHQLWEPGCCSECSTETTPSESQWQLLISILDLQRLLLSSLSHLMISTIALPLHMTSLPLLSHQLLLFSQFSYPTYLYVSSSLYIIFFFWLWYFPKFFLSLLLVSLYYFSWVVLSTLLASFSTNNKPLMPEFYCLTSRPWSRMLAEGFLDNSEELHILDSL